MLLHNLLENEQYHTVPKPTLALVVAKKGYISGKITIQEKHISPARVPMQELMAQMIQMVKQDILIINGFIQFKIC